MGGRGEYYYCEYSQGEMPKSPKGNAQFWGGAEPISGRFFLGAIKGVPHGPHMTKALPQVTRYFFVHTVPRLKRAPCLQHLRSSCWVDQGIAKKMSPGRGQPGQRLPNGPE